MVMVIERKTNPFEITQGKGEKEKEIQFNLSAYYREYFSHTN